MENTMSKITLQVKDSELQTVLTILKNLKEGLVQSIEVDGQETQSRQTRYQPKSDKVVVAEGERPSGKYLSKDAYRARLFKNR